jgi:putative restriction endonuclease
LDNRIHPKSHIGELRGLLLPEKYSPVRANGDGLQSVHLAEVGRPFAAALFHLIGGEANKFADVAKEGDRGEQLSPSREPDFEEWEERVEHGRRATPRHLGANCTQLLQTAERAKSMTYEKRSYMGTWRR